MGPMAGGHESQAHDPHLGTPVTQADLLKAPGLTAPMIQGDPELSREIGGEEQGHQVKGKRNEDHLTRAEIQFASWGK